MHGCVPKRRPEIATAPYFVISPNTVLSIVGLLHGPDKTVPTPPEDWRMATVDVVIPAYNEEYNIVLCLESILRQTLKPNRIILIDDGSSDKTLEYAETFCNENGVELISIQREKSIGKTPTIKRQSREFDSDVEFILDGDTVLESENYIERTVEELYKAVGIASACGTILPLRDRDRRRLKKTTEVQRFLLEEPGARMFPPGGVLSRLNRALTNLYRDALYMFLQRFVYHGQMVFFGSISHPVGCAVAYRREYIKDLFEKYEPIFGDDLTNSEDIFIGFALVNKGYRNIQLMDVTARSEEPMATHLPRQVYLWSSSFLQSCYYFNPLITSPFKVIKRWRHQKKMLKEHGKEIEEKRKIKEPYRQSFGDDYTARYGRPIGWTLFLSAVEKVFFPTAMFMMLMFRLWEPLVVTAAAESVLSLTILTAVAKGRRLEYFMKGILVTPIRYSMILNDLVTIVRFGADLWIFKRRDWRK